MPLPRVATQKKVSVWPYSKSVLIDSLAKFWDQKPSNLCWIKTKTAWWWWWRRSSTNNFRPFFFGWRTFFFPKIHVLLITFQFFFLLMKSKPQQGSISLNISFQMINFIHAESFHSRWFLFQENIYSLEKEFLFLKKNWDQIMFLKSSCRRKQITFFFILAHLHFQEKIIVTKNWLKWKNCFT